MSKYWEVEQNTTQQVLDVQGRLKQCFPFWREVLQAPPTVLEWAENGYRLPLKHDPPPYCRQNHNSTEVHEAFVDETVRDLLDNRCVQRVDEIPTACSPLSVVSNLAGKLRLVLNLRYFKKICTLSSLNMRTFVQRPCCLRKVNTYLNLTLSQATITLIFIQTKHVS